MSEDFLSRKDDTSSGQGAEFTDNLFKSSIKSSIWVRQCIYCLIMRKQSKRIQEKLVGPALPKRILGIIDF